MFWLNPSCLIYAEQCQIICFHLCCILCSFPCLIHGSYIPSFYVDVSGFEKGFPPCSFLLTLYFTTWRPSSSFWRTFSFRIWKILIPSCSRFRNTFLFTANPAQNPLDPEDRWFSVRDFLSLDTVYTYLKALETRLLPLSLNYLSITRATNGEVWHVTYWQNRLRR